MKNLFLTVLFFALGSATFSEIVSWKGMEFGVDSCPVWLEKYLEKKNEKPLRRKFGIEKSKTVVVGVASGESLEAAREFSQTDAIKKYFASIKENQVAQSLTFVYEFWNEDSENGFCVYSVYSF